MSAGSVDRGFYMPMALSEGEVQDGYLLTCIATPESDIVELDCADASSTAKRLPVSLFPPRHDLNFIVVEKIPRTPEIVELRLRPQGKRLKYWPGQYVEVGKSGQHSGRPYSIANAPRADGELSLHVARSPGGRVSNWLHDEVAIGTQLSVSGPYGTFIGDPATTGPVLCIAGGSGLAPILALTDAALRRGFRDPVTLLFSARTTEDLYATGLTSYWEYRHSNFLFVRTITRPSGTDRPPTGRIQEVLPKICDDLDLYHVFIAGNPDFVVACKDTALDLGALESQVYTESYFPGIGQP
jgi:CDP-4-dehydro-6-deoxyglucose reductase